METLEGVRVRLKLRVEQIDVMKERLRVHMEKRGARVSQPPVICAELYSPIHICA